MMNLQFVISKRVFLLLKGTTTTETTTTTPRENTGVYYVC